MHANSPPDAGNVLAIDFGERRVGIAWASPEGQPTALATLQRQSDRQLLSELSRWALEYEITSVLLGLPIGFDGQRGENCERIESLARKIENQLHLPVQLWQETLTTVAAQERLDRLGLRKFRPGLDAMSAQILLEDFRSAQAAGTRETASDREIAP